MIFKSDFSHEKSERCDPKQAVSSSLLFYITENKTSTMIWVSVMLLLTGDFTISVKCNYPVTSIEPVGGKVGNILVFLLAFFF